MSKLDNLEAYKRRAFESNDYLLPEALISEFDRLVNAFYDFDEETDDWHDLCRELDSKFFKYIVEGEQYDIVYYIDPKDLTP